jgi:hypothetical protein
MAKKKNTRIYKVGDTFFEHKRIGGQVIAAIPSGTRQYLLVHREEDDDTFTLYYQDLRHKVLPALTRCWPGAILEELLEVLSDYRQGQPRKRKRRRRQPVVDQRVEPVEPRDPPEDEERSSAEDSEAPPPPCEGSVSSGHIGLCL